MVLAHIKHKDQSLFLLDVPSTTQVEDLLQKAVFLYNGILKIKDLCSEMEELGTYGASLPPPMVGLLDEQITELGLKDDWTPSHPPTDGYSTNKDLCGRRNGQQPVPEMQKVISDTIAEAKGNISKELVASQKCLTEEHIGHCLSMLRGAVSIVYPDGLPPYDPVQKHFDDERPKEIKGVLETSLAQIWFASKELQRDKNLHEYIGKNEKTKVVLKLTAAGHGAPSREPQLSHDQQASMMQYWHQRREDLKKLEEDADDSYLNSKWANSKDLQQQFHGIKDIKWRPQS